METISLRCTTCGAPLPKPEPGEEWVKCEYCGFLNKIVDASKYIEKLKNDIQKWIREILPPTVISSTTIDVAARYQIFQSIIKPKLAIIKANMKAKYLQYISNPITPIPPPKPLGEDSKVYFEESLKIQTIRDFAVSDDDVKYLIEALMFTNVSGYLVNAFNALSKFEIRSAYKNIEEAWMSIPDYPEYSLIKQRLNAVKTTLLAVQQIYERNTLSALDLSKIAIELYSDLLVKASSSTMPEVNKGLIEVEKTIAETVFNIAESSHRFFTSGIDPLEAMKWIESYMEVFTWIRENYRRPIQDLLELSILFKKFVYAKTGSPELNIARGEGSIYIPFYVVECRVSYPKGFIFKKGLETKMMLLVSSIVPYVENPVTDVLGLYTRRLIPPDQVENSPVLKTINELLSTARRDHLPSGVKSTSPFITSVLAEKISDNYIQEANNRYGGKIKFASTNTIGVLYLPFKTLDSKTLVSDHGLVLKLRVELDNLLKHFI